MVNTEHNQLSEELNDKKSNIPYGKIIGGVAIAGLFLGTAYLNKINYDKISNKVSHITSKLESKFDNLTRENVDLKNSIKNNSQKLGGLFQLVNKNSTNIETIKKDIINYNKKSKGLVQLVDKNSTNIKRLEKLYDNKSAVNTNDSNFIQNSSDNSSKEVKKTYSFPMLDNGSILNIIPDKISFEKNDNNTSYWTNVEYDDNRTVKYETYGKDGFLNKIIKGFQDNPSEPKETYNGLVYVSNNCHQDFIRYFFDAERNNPDNRSIEILSAFVDVVAFTKYMSDYIDSNLDNTTREIVFNQHKLNEFNEKYSKIAIKAPTIDKIIDWTHPVGWIKMLSRGFSQDSTHNTTGHGSLNYLGNKTFFKDNLDENNKVKTDIAVKRLESNIETYLGVLGLINGGNKK